MKRQFLTLGLTAWAIAVRAVDFTVVNDHTNLLYRLGETATFTVTAKEKDGTLATNGIFDATLDNFGPKRQHSERIDLSKTNPFVLKGSLDAPGFLRLTIRGKAASTPFFWGVGYEPEKIRKGSPSPTDFDDFWSAAIARFEREVPLDLRMSRMPERCTKDYAFYRISFATYGRRIHGYLSIPTDRSKAPFPVEVEVPGAGFGNWTNRCRGRADAIVAHLTVYPFEPDWEWEAHDLKKTYDAMNAGFKAQYGTECWQAGIAKSREDYFYYPVILGINRAVDWLAARPDADLRNFRYHGTSQGGAFGFILTALNRHFTRAVFYVPAMTDTLGYRAGRRSGWPQIVESQREECKAAAEANAPYFDAANFASRIRCPVRIVVGFADITCSPSGVYAAYNEIKVADKAILHGFGMGHAVRSEFHNALDPWLRKTDGPLAAPGLPHAKAGAHEAPATAQDLTAFVDPFIGTAGTGHCFPGPCRPFGLVQPSPETGNGSWRYCAGYNHDDARILCFAQTHLNGTGQASLGDVAVMPVVPDATKQNERAEAGYYAVEFAGGVKVEIAAGCRLACYRFTFPENVPAAIRLDFRHGLYRDNAYLKYLATSSVVEQVGMDGFRGENHSDVWTPRTIGYVLRFDREFSSYANGVCLFPQGGTIGLRVAISSRSRAGAQRNFDAEGHLSFDELVSAAKADWNSYLARLAFPGGDDASRRSLYTALYHLCIQPNMISDADEPPRYSTFSLWDTCRSAHPLYEKLVPELVPQFVNSLLDHYGRWGYLPRWELWGRESNCMVGDPAVSVIADAYLHGLRDGVDWNVAARAVKETLTTNRRKDNPGFYPPREDRDVYAKYGYFPYDVVTAQSVSRTLENSFCDFKAAELMRALGRKADADFFERRSWNFTNLWDAATLCFRPKDSKGAWLAAFEPARQSQHYTEGSALQYSWLVPHRPRWLIAAMGGRESFLKRLDAFFAGTLCPGAVRGYGQDVTGLIGDYSHGNEPCHHIPYLYSAAGRPEKTAALLKRICSEFYRPSPDGLCGNDDCGQMSAWYVLARQCQ